MIKVLHVFGKMDRGGAETRTIEVTPLLAERGVEFDFCTLSAGAGQLDELIRQLGREVFPCPLRPGLMSFGSRFVRFLKNSDYDIVHSHSHYFSGYIVKLAHKAGIKSRIAHFRNTYDGKSLNLQRKIYKRIMRKWIGEHATAILAVCRGAMELGWGEDWEKDSRAKVVYNGLDLSRFQFTGQERRDVLSELGIPHDSKIIINVANLRRQKAHDVLLDAAAKLVEVDSKYHFLLVGDGVLRDEMEAKAENLQIIENIHFLGVREDVPKLLKASDCFVLSSRWEGLPGVVLEAIAAGLLVVATDLPGVKEIAEHTNLINIVKVEDAEALAKGILDVFNNSYLQQKQGQPFPKEFGLEQCAETLYNIYISQLKG